MLRGLIFAAIVLVAAIGWMLVLPAAPIAQPVAFNHARHERLACVVCHRGVETGARATVPQANVCLNCHATPPPRVVPAIWDEAARSGRFGWVRVTNVPGHVMFSHRRHVAVAKLECASCHGDIGRQSAPPARAPLRLDMSACLSCHQREGASADCAACHR